MSDELEALRAENNRLRKALTEKITAETLLTALELRPGKLFAEFEGGVAGLLGSAFFDMVQDCENYIECEFRTRNFKRVLVTVQKPDKKTPHQLRREAEAERDALKKELEQRQ